MRCFRCLLFEKIVDSFVLRVISRCAVEVDDDLLPLGLADDVKIRNRRGRFLRRTLN